DIEENSRGEFTEQGDINESFQDIWNRLGQRSDRERRLDKKSRSKVGLSPPNSISTTQTIPSIRSNGQSLLIQGNAVQNTALPNLLRTSTSNGPNQDTERIKYKNSQLCRRSTTPTFGQGKITKIKIDNNENSGIIWVVNGLKNARYRTKTTEQLLKMVLRLGKDVFIDEKSKKTRITFPIKDNHQRNRDTNPNQDQISCFDNRKTQFSKCPSKRSFLLLKIYAFSKN
ncbi:MAG: hypothetical protein EZS28_009946, partial [Streblomastix strix]